MKTNHLTHLFLTTVVAAALAGCASAPSHFYTLTSTAAGDGTPPASYAVVVGPVSIPGSVDRPEFTIQAGTNRVEIDEFNRWAAPLSDNIARAVAGDLAVLLGTPQVAMAGLANFDPAYRVTIDIQRFESLRSPGMGDSSVLVEAMWVIRRTAGGTAHPGHTVASEPAPGGSFEALAAAHSRALAKVSSDIAAAIRADADGK
jgi:uncharacterized lipoprotein YmbA